MKCVPFGKDHDSYGAMSMPIISMLYEIIIRMDLLNTRRH
jgi:hypothetical protein